MKKTTVVAFFTFLSFCMFPQVQVVSVDEFERLIDSVGIEQLVDLRTPAEFEVNRIGGAKNKDIRNAEFKKNIEKLDKEKPVFIYCFVDLRSQASIKFFTEAGFKSIYMLGGGINAWMRAGKPAVLNLPAESEFSQEYYDSVAFQKGYVLVDFYATWCAPCVGMLPMLEDLAKDYHDKFKLFLVNFERNRRLADEQNVRSIPHLILFRDGKKIWEKVGETNREELMGVMNLQ